MNSPGPGPKATNHNRLRELLLLFHQQSSSTDWQQFLEAYPNEADALREVMKQIQSGSPPEGYELIADLSFVGPGHDEETKLNNVRSAGDESLVLLELPDDETDSFEEAEPSPVPRSSMMTAWGEHAGQVFGEYELLKPVGRGGMGVVYKARQVKLDRTVAVKMILAGQLANENELARFYAEAQAAGNLKHSNIVQIHMVGEIDGHHYYSMDYIEGKTLAELRRERKLAPEQAARYVKIVAEAVDYAHRQGILHRDLKPGNILIDQQDQPHITDFGLAKRLNDELHLTADGTALGTPSYMSPEQAQALGSQIGPATDIYSLGVILYELLAQRVPFKEESPWDTISAVIHKQPEPPRKWNRSIPPELQAVVMKCLRKEPEKRYASAQELADDLQRFLDGEPVLAKPQGIASRTYQFLITVPLIAALLGRRAAAATLWHHRFQYGLIALPLLLLAGVAAWNLMPERLPKEIRIAGGIADGVYCEFADIIAEELVESVERPVHAIVTPGSMHNQQMLLSEQADLALVQGNTMVDKRLAIVAPLYYETVLVIVRAELDIDSMDALTGLRVAVGPEQSGMRKTAEELCEFYDLSSKDVTFSEAHFYEMQENRSLDAAIATIALNSQKLREMLGTGEYRLVPISNAEDLALRDPSLRAVHLSGEDFPAEVNAPASFRTLLTPAFLVARKDTPHVLVEQALATLYSASLQERFQGKADSLPGLISRREAARWRNLDLHPAAADFFDAISQP